MTWPEEDWERAEPPVTLSDEELDALLGDCRPRRVELLGAGKANTNLKVEDEVRTVVLRIYQRDPHALERERRLWERVGRVVPVPTCRGIGRTAAGLPVAVLDFVHGIPPTQRLAEEPSSAWSVGEAIGTALAPLAAVPVEGVGLFAPDLSLQRRFDSLITCFDDLLTWSLTRGRARRRLGVRAERLRASLPLLYERLSPLDEHIGLCHGDFKSPNLLLDGPADAPRVVAVLDWEYAAPLTPLLDVGNLLRHRDAFPAALQDGFEAGYRAGGAWLPEDWRAISRLVDLVNLVGFLNGGAPRPQLYDAVLHRIDCTLDHLHGVAGGY